MRTTQRDRRAIWYALYTGLAEVMDSDGNYTGEKTVTYAEPVKAYMNVSGGKGKAAVECFGIDTPFTKVAVTEDLATPFDTDTIFWFGVEPTDGQGNDVAHNFRCTGISRTINGVAIALEEVDITHEDGNTPIISG